MTNDKKSTCDDHTCFSCNVGLLTDNQAVRILQSVKSAKSGKCFIISIVGDPNECEIFTNVSPMFLHGIISSIYDNLKALSTTDFKHDGVVLHEPSVKAAFEAMLQPIDEDLDDDAKRLLQTVRCLTAYFNSMLPATDGVTLQ